MDIRKYGRKFEVTENGQLYMPESRVFLGGVFEHELIRNGESLGVQRDANLVTNEGLDHVLSVLLAGGTQVSPWYVGLFEGNYTPVAGDTAATFVASSTESTAYDEAARQAYVEAAPSSQSVTNSSNKATFTMNATKTIYGAFLASASAKSATTGTLLSASRFSSSRAVVDNDQLLVTYTFSAADA